MKKNIHFRFASVAFGAVLLAALPALASADSPFVAITAAPQSHMFTKASTPLDTSTTLRVGFSLSGFRKQAADAFVDDLYNRNSPNFHHWISTTTFGQYFGACDGDIQAMTKYLTSQGFTDITVGEDRSYISATGTVKVAQNAFKVSFANFVRPSELVSKGDPAIFYGATTSVSLPTNLAEKVSGAFGFENLLLSHPGVRSMKRLAHKRGITGFTPNQISIAYNSAPFENANRGHDMSIAVFSPTRRYPDDAQIFANHLGLTDDFLIIDKLIDGGNTGNGGAIEASCDQEMIVGQANHAKVYMVQPNGLTTGEIDAYNWVGKNNIPVLSSSWTTEESWVIKYSQQTWANQFVTTCEGLAAAGVTMFNDTGDAAAFGGPTTQSVGMECCCPYLTAVGGTALTTNKDYTWKSEILWDYNGKRNNPVGGSGGISKLFKQPSWQTGYGVKNSYSNGYREIPDVSANAAQDTYYYVVLNGSDNGQAGTSLSTPLWAANLLLMEESFSTSEGRTVRFGNINPILYELGNNFENPNLDWNMETCFHDITSGTNGLYPTTVGYDLCAGWGSANFGRLFVDYGAAETFKGYSPDFQPYTPSGWTHPLMIHTVENTVTEPSSFQHGVKYYIAGCSANLGTADGPASPFGVYLDGKEVSLNELIPSEPMGTYFQSPNVLGTTVTFTKGTHKIEVILNPGTSVYEANHNNNDYTRTITVN